MMSSMFTLGKRYPFVYKMKTINHHYETVKSELLAEPRTWLITGVAGFIGSNILRTLLLLNQRVIGLDNLSTGRIENLDIVKARVLSSQWRGFQFIEGDIRNRLTSEASVRGVNYVLHQAALGSVPRSLKDPINTNESNVQGFLNILEASRLANVSRFIYASSSAVYGDWPEVEKIESKLGNPVSPYGLTKLINEKYASLYELNYKFLTTGLRYFNVYGENQSYDGEYSAVIPRWIRAGLTGKDVEIFGDGDTSRDFCHVENVIQANILAACQKNVIRSNIYNIAVGDSITLNRLIKILDRTMNELGLIFRSEIVRKDFRQGDIRQSKANINKARDELKYHPTHTLEQQLIDVVKWYKRNYNE